MTKPAIVVQGLGKKFKKFPSNYPRKVKHLLTGSLLKTGSRESFWCLRDVSFEIHQGQMLGIIGPNGSGKSTLLRLIGGVGRPDEGSISVNGRIGALFDLGVGFHYDLSGRDNIFIGGVAAGLTRRQILKRFDEIVSFSELENFLDYPLRTYSSGMKMRLAFAVAANIDPDILIIDEVLYVGDLAFQSKCLERIQHFRLNGCTVLLVTHDIQQVENFCDNAIWLKQGKVYGQGSPQQITQAYAEEMVQETKRKTDLALTGSTTQNDKSLQLNKNRFGSLEIEITGVCLKGSLGVQIMEYSIGDSLRIEIDYESHLSAVDPIFGVTITDAQDHICCEMLHENDRPQLNDDRRRGTMILEIERLDLNGGEYFVNVGIYEKNWKYAYDYHWQVYPLRVRPYTSLKGILSPPHKWSWSTNRNIG
jgi:lipopolysaccharide transport system ATP-binding protein